MNFLDSFWHYLDKKSYYHIGYPVNLQFDLSALFPFFNLHINNAGDPFTENNCQLNVKNVEVEVLEFYANLYHLKEDDFWGYMTHGSTESNEYGILLGREAYPEGILYFSEATHGCIINSAKKLRMNTCIIPTNKRGEINYQLLIEAIDDNYKKDNRNLPIIIANIGTTMTGAIDNIEKIIALLHQNNIEQFYIHCDAAFFGGFLPFTGLKDQVSFKHPIDSIAISLHKFLGSCISSSIVLHRNSPTHFHKFHHQEYINTTRILLSTSRNGLASLIAWHRIKQLGKLGMKELISECFQMAKYAKEKFSDTGIYCFVNPYSNIFVFEKPSNFILKKWQLPVDKELSHIVFLPNVTKEKIDEFIEDMINTKNSQNSLTG